MQVDKRYYKLALRYNPFPIDTGADTYVRKLDDLVIVEDLNPDVYLSLKNMAHGIRSGCPTFIVHGEWGSGKTHALLSFAKYVKEHLRASKEEGGECEKFIFVHVTPTPVEKDETFYREVLQRFAETLEDSECPGLEELIKTLRSCEPRKGLECLKKVLRNLIIDRDFIVYIALDQIERDVMPILANPNTQQKIAEIAQRLESFARRLTSCVGRGLAIGLSMYDPAYTAIEKHLAKGYFQELALQPLDLEGIKKLIKGYISIARAREEELLEELSPQEVKLIKDLMENSDTYPFSNDAVKAIHEIIFRKGSQTPRMVCTYAGRALAHAAESGAYEVTRYIVYAAVDPKYEEYMRVIRDTYLTWIRITTAIRKILEKASEYGIIMYYPQRLSDDDAKRYFRLKKGYAIKDNVFVIEDHLGVKLVYVCRKISSRVTVDDIKEMLNSIDTLRNAGIDVRKIVFIYFTEMSREARQWKLAAQKRNVALEFVKVKEDAFELGELLYIANNIENESALRRVGISDLRAELEKILRDNLKITS